MKRLGFIIQEANRETKPKTQTTSTDDTQIPRADLRFAKEKQQRSKTRKGARAQTLSEAPVKPLKTRPSPS